MNIAFGLLACALLLARSEKGMPAFVAFYAMFAAVLLLLQLVLLSGPLPGIDDRGFLNVLFAAPIYILASKVKLKKSLAVFLMALPIIVPLIFGFSSYYWKYMLGGATILAAIGVSDFPSLRRKIVFFLCIAALAATLEKYAIIFFAIALYSSGLTKRPLVLILVLSLFLAAFYFSIENSQYGSVAEFMDRRVTRDSYQSAQGSTVFGISDGSRFEIWQQQLNVAAERILFGSGTEWAFFDSDVPNHNLAVTYLLTFGVAGSLLIVFSIALGIGAVPDRGFRLCFIAILLISFVGEGVLLPYIVAAVALQSAIFKSAFERRLKEDGKIPFSARRRP